MGIRNSLKTAIRRALHEPLLQFLVLGGLLFISAHVVAHREDELNREIVIDSALAGRLAKLYEMQTGVQPSKARLDALIDEHIRDEVLFREAIKIGLDQNDEIIRRRLTQKLDFLQRDLVVIPEPALAELQRYYETHRADFTEPEAITFSHVYFSPDQDGSEAAQTRAEQVLAQLKIASTQRAPQLGDSFPLQYDYADLNRQDTIQLFGQTPIVDALFAAQPGQWNGPFHSGYGWHLVYINRKKEAAVTPFEQAREKVRQAYLDKARAEANAQKFEELKSSYAIARLDREAKR